MSRRPASTLIAVYIRVSTTEQATSGLGLADQTSRCRAYIEALGLGSDVRVFVDAGESAGSLNRPALQELLELVRVRKVAAVVVTKVDRLSRSLRDLLELVRSFESKGVALHAVTERIDTASAAGRMMLQMLGAMGEFEREMIRERTKAAVATKRAQGLAHGFDPLGSTNVAGRLQAVAAEVETIDLMVRRRGEGASLRQIASELTSKGYQTKRGGAWRACTVDVVLRRVSKGFATHCNA